MSTLKTFRLLIGYFYTVLSILAPTVLSTNFPWDNFQETSKSTCESQECKAMAQDLIHGIKSNVDPCKDFYEYVCGNWKKHSELEPYQGFLNSESILQYTAYKKLKSKLEESTKSHEDPEISKAKQLYRHCMKLPYLERVDAKDLREHMKTYGFWDAKQHPTGESWLTIHNYYLSIAGDSAFFQFDLHMSKDDSVPYIRLQRTSSHYGALQHTYEWEVDQRKYYFTFLEKVVQMVAGSKESTFSSKNLEDDIRDVFNFRLSLQKLSISEIDPTISTSLKIKELAEWYQEGKNCPENGHGKINWLDVFHAFVKHDKDIKITDETTIHVHSKDYLHRLCSLITHTRKRTIVNHVHLYFMERHIALKPELKNLLTFSITQGLVSHGKIMYISEQWYFCIRNHNMHGALSALYTKSFLTDTMLQESQYMIDHIKEVMMLQIRGTKWLSDSAKRSTIEKLRNVKLIVGYPKERDLNISPETSSRLTKLVENSIEPNAFYSDRDNLVFVSSMYFQQPFFDQNLPFTITYAALGSLIAHEAYHMFDETVVANTALHQIWGRKASKHYKDNVECFMDYYSKQPIQELEYKTNDKPKLNSLLTRDENIADAMGLKTSYNAYKKMLWTRKGICTTIDGFKNIPCDKLFFIAYARTFCSRIPREKMIRNLSHSKHSPSRLRVNVPVSSMPEFSRAFKCEVDEPLNPYEKCDLWG